MNQAPPDVGWIRGSLTDEHGFWDVAYVSLFMVMWVCLTACAVQCGLAIASEVRCKPQVLVVKDAVTIVECKTPIEQLGTGIGYTLGGFGVALGALAGYMAATRRPIASTVTQVTQTTTP